MPDLTPTPHEHIVATEFEGGEGVLVDLNTKRYYQLNETAMIVWRGLEGNRTLAEIISEVTANYEVSPEHAAASIAKCLRDLEANKLIRSRS
jgi:hypothetical protein